MMRCFHCGAIATHFCDICGKWLCDSRFCEVASGASGAIQHPIRTTKLVAQTLFNPLRRW